MQTAAAKLALDPLSGALDLIVAVVVAWLASRRPVAAVGALILIEPFALYRYVGGTTITLPKVALLGAAVGLLIAARGHLKVLLEPERRRPGALLAATIGLVILATALTYPFAAEHAPVIREVLKWLEYLAIFAVAAAAFWLDPDPGAVRWPLAVALCAISVLALAQLFVGATQFYPIGGDRAIVRVAGPLEGPNQLAGYIGLALPVLTAAATFAGLDALTTVALGLGGMALVLTLSRAGIFATVVAIAVALAAAPATARLRRTIAFILGGAGVLGGVVLGLETFVAGGGTGHAGVGVAHIFSAADVDRTGGVGHRDELWRGAWQLWRAHPLFGVGAGNYQDEIGPLLGKPVRTHANSWYLQSLVEGGIPLLAATLALAAASIAAFARRARSHWLLAGALAASVGFVLHQVLDFLVFYPKVASLWFILLGVAASAALRVEPDLSYSERFS